MKPIDPKIPEAFASGMCECDSGCPASTCNSHCVVSYYSFDSQMVDWMDRARRSGLADLYLGS
jgi:hypothetical protein